MYKHSMRNRYHFSARTARYFLLKRHSEVLVFGASMAVTFACLFSGAIGQGATVTYTLDAQQSYLNFSAIVTSYNFPSQPQKPGGDTTHLTGTLAGNLNGNAITFSGTSNLVATQNSAGFFLPDPNPPLANRIDNVG